MMIDNVNKNSYINNAVCILKCCDKYPYITFFLHNCWWNDSSDLCTLTLVGYFVILLFEMRRTYYSYIFFYHMLHLGAVDKVFHSVPFDILIGIGFFFFFLVFPSMLVYITPDQKRTECETNCHKKVATVASRVWASWA